MARQPSSLLNRKLSRHRCRAMFIVADLSKTCQACRQFILIREKEIAIFIKTDEGSLTQCNRANASKEAVLYENMLLLTYLH